MALAKLQLATVETFYRVTHQEDLNASIRALPLPTNKSNGFNEREVFITQANFLNEELQQSRQIKIDDLTKAKKHVTTQDGQFST